MGKGYGLREPCMVGKNSKPKKRKKDERRQKNKNGRKTYDYNQSHHSVNHVWSWGPRNNIHCDLDLYLY